MPYIIIAAVPEPIHRLRNYIYRARSWFAPRLTHSTRIYPVSTSPQIHNISVTHQNPSPQWHLQPPSYQDSTPSSLKTWTPSLQPGASISTLWTPSPPSRAWRQTQHTTPIKSFSSTKLAGSPWPLSSCLLVCIATRMISACGGSSSRRSSCPILLG